MKTATFVRDILGWMGDARLYHLSEPMPYDNLEGKDKSTTEYVIVSAVNAAFSGPETYIFPATDSGHTLNMLELEGSFRGGTDHDEALKRAGYEVR